MGVGTRVDVPIIGVEVGLPPADATDAGVAVATRTVATRVEVAVATCGVSVAVGVCTGVRVGVWVAVRVAVGVGVSIGVEVGGFAFCVRAAVVAVAVGEAPGRSAFSPAADAADANPPGGVRLPAPGFSWDEFANSSIPANTIAAATPMPASQKP